jgi:hypothetical protein
MKKTWRSWQGIRGIVGGAALLGTACGDVNTFEGEAEDVGTTESEDVGTTTSALTTAALHSLLITHLKVVDHPLYTIEPCTAIPSDANTKVWSLPYLLTKEAARYGIPSTTYVADWLDAWNTSSTVNGETVPVKGAPRVIAEWPKDAGGKYLIEKAPFRLLAIVSRLDLRKFRPEGEPMGGEVRFVFGTTETTLCPRRPGEQTIILEYSPGKTDENAVLDWAKRWYALGNLDRESDTYVSELKKLTDETLQLGRLERVRANEVALGETFTTGWFLTEFVPSAGGALVRSTVKQTPRESLRRGSPRLSGFIATNVRNLETVFQVPQKGYMYNAGTGYRVTDTFTDGALFRGGSAISTKVAPSKFWNSTRRTDIDPYTWSLARHRFSLGTCNGCHGGEGGLAGIFHIQPREVGFQAVLSPFLSGGSVATDPVDGTQRPYNEMLRRQEDLHWLANEMPLGNPVFGNYDKMRFQHSGKCMDLEFESTAPNALVKQYPCHGRGNQRLTMVDRGNIEFSVKFKHSGLCLDVENGSAANGARVVQKTCDAAVNSQKFTWFATSGTNSPIVLTFKHSNKCLRVENQSTSDAAQVIQDACSYVSSRGLFLIE